MGNHSVNLCLVRCISNGFSVYGMGDPHCVTGFLASYFKEVLCGDMRWRNVLGGFSFMSIVLEGLV